MLNSIYFLPHGMQIIPGMEDPYNFDFEKLHIEMEKIKEVLESESSELIILVTPHGLNLEDRFLIYEHNELIGHYYRILEKQSVVYGDLVDTKKWQGSQETSLQLKQFLTNCDIDIEGLTQGYADYPLTLAWGETVPLYYLPEELNQQILVIGVPRSRHDKIYNMQESLVKFGQSIIEFCKNHSKSTSIIFSGDLSHTHTEDGPYGYHQSSKEFDRLVQLWSTDPKREIFEEILELQKTALACGMAGISMLQGIADKYQIYLKTSYYDLPTYFGMIVNQWKLNI
ncbi:MAG: hypothetical protein GPJ54_16140 [Candidatus Heimdallarchaeota archaeon]|nr:hypothetical protein [Candidatus Heimdallarchaeota archaeon]